jgi:hypothetical protein
MISTPSPLNAIKQRSARIQGTTARRLLTAVTLQIVLKRHQVGWDGGVGRLGQHRIGGTRFE